MEIRMAMERRGCRINSFEALYRDYHDYVQLNVVGYHLQKRAHLRYCVLTRLIRLKMLDMYHCNLSLIHIKSCRRSFMAVGKPGRGLYLFCLGFFFRFTIQLYNMHRSFLYSFVFYIHTCIVVDIFSEHQHIFLSFSFGSLHQILFH